MTHNRFLDRRSLLTATALAGAATAGVTGVALAEPDKKKSKAAELTWLGNNAWKITTKTDKPATILIDPWLTRFHTGTYTDEGADPETPLEVDPDTIDPHIDTADQILVTHGHYDHITDVPYIATKTGATVFGTATHLNLLRALEAPDEQLSYVRGGEYFQFDGYTIEVFRSNHSAGGDHMKVAFAGVYPSQVPERPRVIKDLVEGESLAYLITVGGVQILNFGSGNYAGRELEGLRPDVVMVQPGGATVPGYVPRLMETLGNPPYVMATHWDDFDYPLDEPAQDWGGVDALEEAVAKASPDSTFVKIDHLETFTV